MSATQPLYCLLGIKPENVSMDIGALIDLDIFVRLCDELQTYYKEQQKIYFRLIKLNKEMEDIAMEKNFLGFIIKDILDTNEYNLSGLAIYTYTPEDVIQEVLDGRNTSPSVSFTKRVIEIHRTVRRDLYELLMKKIAADYLMVA